MYGTPEAPVRRAVAESKVILLEIEIQGAVQLAERMPESIRIFLLPPSEEELRRRLSGRRTESPQQQSGRLEQALKEIAFARSSEVYQYLVTNDSIQGSAQDILEIIEKERNCQ
jgi:guanylate kinase